MAAPRSLPASSFCSSTPNPSPWVPQHHRDITLARIDAFLTAGQFADRNIRADLWRARCDCCVTLEVYNHPKDVPYPTYDEAVRKPYVPAKVGDSFGPSWTTHWFRVRARVPAEWAGQGPLLFRWDSGSEAMLYLNGPTPTQGITDQRNEVKLAEVAAGGQEFLFYVEMAANGMFGNTPSDIQPPDENRYFTLKAAELVLPNLAVTALYHDLKALAGLAKELQPPGGNTTGEMALYTANKILNTYRSGDSDAVEACRALAASVLAVRDPGERMQVYAVGHCHIDTAWLWPFSETHRKTARSWSSQLRLAERYPWHVFTASSAQQYEWLAADYPGLFAEVQAAAGRGSFVPVGGTWVEMDTNVPSGESLVRQFLYGQRFFTTHFGSPCDVFWLPDTFGYCGQLPQIARGAGIRYFLTQKLSWNNINTFPHTTFYWSGIDGTNLLTHFPPANTYNAQADVKDIQATATGSKDKDRSPAAYMLFGNGDGGGGPTVDMCESLARLAGCRGLAALKLAAPSEFFRQLEASSQDLLTWRGELYFELHRGTYTTHAANKADNRSCELLLREAEAAGAAAAVLLPPGAYEYPRCQLDAIWKDVLLYQFHDVLPGSAIQRVYDVTAKRYPEMLSELRHIRDTALSALLAAVQPPPPRAATTAAPTTAAAAGGVYTAGPAVVSGPGAVTRLCPSLQSCCYVADTVVDAFPSAVPSGAASAAASTAAAAATATAAAATTEVEELFPQLRFEDIAGARPLPAPPPPLASRLPYNAATAAAVVAWVYNSLGFARREVVSVPLPASMTSPPVAGCGGHNAALLPAGTAVRQMSSNGHTALVVVQAPPFGLIPVTAQDLAMGCNVAAAEAMVAAPTTPSVVTTSGSYSNRDPIQRVTVYRTELPYDSSLVVPRRTAGGGGGACGGGVVATGGVDGGPAGAAGGGGVVAYVMQNSMIRATFDECGRLVSLYDMVWERELVPEGAAGNVFRFYEDMPIFWDAWDIEVYHLEKGWPAGQGMPPPKLSILESGPIRCRLGVEMQLTPKSSLKQIISLTAVSQRLDFHCEIMWAENRTALKVEFPWQLDSPEATYEVQYGAVQRPTHTNTSWDWARFEVCAHKWADLSEPGYGVALLNDCKYGHATHGNTMRLTLLRSPKAPDAHTDMGTHAMRFAVLPHAQGWATAGVVPHGWAFNAPMRLLPPPPPPPLLAPTTPSSSAQSAHPYCFMQTPLPPPSPPPPLTISPPRGDTRHAARNDLVVAVGRRGVAGSRGFDLTQPMFVVTSARPNPLLAPGPKHHAASATAAATPAAPNLCPPPLILETIKLAEPPLSTTSGRTNHHHPARAPQPPQQQLQQLQPPHWGATMPAPGSVGYSQQPLAAAPGTATTTTSTATTSSGCTTTTVTTITTTTTTSSNTSASTAPAMSANPSFTMSRTVGSAAACVPGRDGGASAGGIAAVSAPGGGGGALALVLRLYEPHGGRGVARISWPSWLRVAHVTRCNLLEEDEGDADGGRAGWGGEWGQGQGRGQGWGLLVVRGTEEAGGSVDVPYAPFKIITLKFYVEQ